MPGLRDDTLLLYSGFSSAPCFLLPSSSRIFTPDNFRALPETEVKPHYIYFIKKIEDIRKSRQIVLKESKIIELTRKFQFAKYTFSRLTDNLIFDLIRNYLAAFYIISFRHWANPRFLTRFGWKRKVYQLGKDHLNCLWFQTKMERGTERHCLNYSTADKEHSVFVQKLHCYIFFVSSLRLTTLTCGPEDTNRLS